MKKFFTVISLQGKKDLELTHYKCEENKSLDFGDDVVTRFPITLTIRASVKKREKIEIFPIIVDNGEGTTTQNYEFFKSEIAKLSEEKGFTYTMTEIRKGINDTTDEMIKLFLSLIKHVGNKDKLFACITYGTKPMSVVTIMALHYAYKVKSNVSIENIVYGLNNWNIEGHPAFIHDVTPLFYIDSAVDSLASMKLKDPEKALRLILDEEGN